MFERRLKIILLIFSVATGALLLRAFQAQVVAKAYWQGEASRVLTRGRTLETLRGSILDFQGRPMAVDRPCIDAAVDYRAIKPELNDKWLKDQARARLRAKYIDQWESFPFAKRQQLLNDEVAAVKADINSMWTLLADAGAMQLGEIEQIRHDIIERVESRKRFVKFANYQKAFDRYQGRDSAAWKTWLLGGGERVPELDDFDIIVGDELTPQVILHGIDNRTQNYLGKLGDRLPGLVLQPSATRSYPAMQVAAHVVGSMGKVNDDDRTNDAEGLDPLRAYEPSDPIGKTGLEALFEPALRGTRGNENTQDGKTELTAKPKPGHDVRCTIDLGLQASIEKLFAEFKFDPADSATVKMHGAAVVLDVKTNQVRALVSSPTFDPNQLETMYDDLAHDEMNKPLMNRALQAQLEPGSTVKTIVGMAAVTLGLLRPDEGIECTGYLIINGRKMPDLRCWTASKFARRFPAQVPHHQIPDTNPHRGSFGNPDGFLTYTDAIMRSCNVFFETVANRLGSDRLSEWMDKFGLGRPTGIGLTEASGRLPRDYRGDRKTWTTWAAGIGQGSVNATPMQMANVAATIARRGIWMRPTLAAEDGITLKPSSRDRMTSAPSERIDLGVSETALDMVRAGMILVVNDDGGTGSAARRTDMIVAGKTGSAETGKMHIKVWNPITRTYLQDNGHDARVPIEPNKPNHPNPEAPWYRGSDDDQEKLKHAWFMGFAPANDPQIAFCVLVEYGGSGNTVAGPIAKGLLQACVDTGYLRPR